MKTEEELRNDGESERLGMEKFAEIYRKRNDPAPSQPAEPRAPTYDEIGQKALYYSNCAAGETKGSRLLEIFRAALIDMRESCSPAVPQATAAPTDPNDADTGCFPDYNTQAAPPEPVARLSDAEIAAKWFPDFCTGTGIPSSRDQWTSRHLERSLCESALAERGSQDAARIAELEAELKGCDNFDTQSANEAINRIAAAESRVTTLTALLVEIVAQINKLPNVDGWSPISDPKDARMSIAALQECYKDAAMARNGQYTKSEAARVALTAKVEELTVALELMYDKWENGDSCYEDVEELSGYLGHAFRLSDREEERILALLPKQESDKLRELKAGIAAADALTTKLAGVRETLRAHEWDGVMEFDSKTALYYGTCQGCESLANSGHNRDCWLAAVLSALEETKIPIDKPQNAE